MGFLNFYVPQSPREPASLSEPLGIDELLELMDVSPWETTGNG
jgi:hypothetical protein